MFLPLADVLIILLLNTIYSHDVLVVAETILVAGYVVLLAESAVNLHRILFCNLPSGRTPHNLGVAGTAFPHPLSWPAGLQHIQLSTGIIVAHTLFQYKINSKLENLGQVEPHRHKFEHNYVS